MVFTIPVTDETLAVGLIVRDLGQRHYYVAIYRDCITALPPDWEDWLNRREPFLLAHSFATLFKVGRWEVKGQALPELLDGIRLPKFRVKVNGEYYLVNFAGDRERRATEEEVNLLVDLFSISPAALEDVIRFACAGMELPAYAGKCAYAYSMRTAEL